MSEYKRCPHCGKSEARAVKLNTWYRIVCGNCGASAGRGSTEAEALAAWDRRDDAAAGPWRTDKPTEDNRYPVLWDQLEFMECAKPAPAPDLDALISDIAAQLTRAYCKMWDSDEAPKSVHDILRAFAAELGKP